MSGLRRRSYVAEEFSAPVHHPESERPHCWDGWKEESARIQCHIGCIVSSPEEVLGTECLMGLVHMCLRLKGSVKALS
jgi:hypothetical protein